LKVGDLILENREIFSSQRAYHSFMGYARAQVKEMNKSVFQGYMGSKRKALVDEFGYDIKHASHCIRLLRMGIEYVETGHLNVDRTDIDAKELIDIKLGKYKLQDIKDMVDSLFSRAELAIRTTPLPKEPQWDKANELLVHIITEYNKRNP